jgi:hypothetical protein
VSELHSWLAAQHPGLRTYKAFREKAQQLACADKEHRAFYKLLSTMVDPFIDTYNGEALPTELAERTFRRLLNVVQDAENAITLSPEVRMGALNEIASVELI